MMFSHTYAGVERVVLLVEDNPFHAELVQHSLEEMVHIDTYRIDAVHITHVIDGETALDYLFRQGAYENPAESPRPDLILLDLSLPDMNGLDVLARVRNTPDLKTIPVVVLSMSTSGDEVEHAYDCRANSYLIKQTGEDDAFMAQIRSAARSWLLWNVTMHRARHLGHPARDLIGISD